LSGAPGLTGGFVRIPQYDFPVVGTTTGIVVPDQVIIQALGTGGSGLSPSDYHFTITDSGGAASTLFVAAGSHSSGGTEFRNLSFNWNDAQYPGGAGVPGDTVLNLGYFNCLVYRCTFTNCPTTVNFAGFTPGMPDALGSYMKECQVQYSSGPNNATCIIMTGEQCGIVDSIIAQNGPRGVHGPYGPTGCTAIATGGHKAGSEHQVFSGLHLAQWATCIDYSDFNDVGIGSGCQYTTIRDCEMDGFGLGLALPHAGSCINMTTANNAGQIYGQKITNNTMSISQNSNVGNPVVLIDTGALGFGGSGGSNTNVQGIDLIGNFIFGNVTNGDGVHNGVAQNNQYGVQVNAGDSIRIIGGKIGNFGNNANLGADGSANIAITGTVGSVLIDSVDLRPTYANGGSGSTGSGASQYALLVSGALSATSGVVRVSNCDMSGYSGNPVAVTGSVGSGALFITNCTGYNQSGFVVFTGAPSNAPTGGTSASTAGTLTGGHNFYGPSTIYFDVGSGGSATLTINTVTQTFPANSSQAISLSSPYDLIAFGSTTNLSLFKWVGA
jgi:hypothetical protein